MGELGELRALGKLGVPVLKRTGAYPWGGLGGGFPFRLGGASVRRAASGFSCGRLTVIRRPPDLLAAGLRKPAAIGCTACGLLMMQCAGSDLLFNLYVCLKTLLPCQVNAKAELKLRSTQVRNYIVSIRQAVYSNSSRCVIILLEHFGICSG